MCEEGAGLCYLWFYLLFTAKGHKDLRDVPKFILGGAGAGCGEAGDSKVWENFSRLFFETFI